MIIDKLVRYRSRDWSLWLALVVYGNGNQVTAYVERWLQGHFLPVEPVAVAYRMWRDHFQRLASGRRIGAVSINALRVAGVI
jgi:hypothetical protein